MVGSHRQFSHHQPVTRCHYPVKKYEQKDNPTRSQKPMPSHQSHHMPRIQFNPSQPRLVRLDWWEKAAVTMTTGKAMHLCVGLWLLITIKQSASVQLTRRMMARINISRYAAGDALRKMECAGLIKVARLQGRSPLITVVEPGTSIPLHLKGNLTR